MLPKVILHTAVSLDGRLDNFAPDVGLFYRLVSRWKEDATLPGSETILTAPVEIPDEEDYFDFAVKDDAEIDNRPLLVVPDSRGRIRTWHFWRDQEYWRDVIVLCSNSTPEDYFEYLQFRQIKYIIAGKNKVDLRAALTELKSRYNVNTVRVDSGGTLNGILLREGLVNEVSMLIHPNLVGGLSPNSLFKAEDLDSKDSVIDLKLVHFEKMDNDIIWLIYEI